MDLSNYLLDRLREDAESGLYRGRAPDSPRTSLLVIPAPRAPITRLVARFEQEMNLADALDASWAIRPTAIGVFHGRPTLVLDDPGGLPLESTLGRPLPLKPCLAIAAAMAAALRCVHGAGLIHKDVRPANVFVDAAGGVRLCGFGFASRLTRERQATETPDIIPGTLAYMAPEQTGRVNRFIDNRSDLYSLGITMYEMIVGALPFLAQQPTEWIFSHVARLPPPPSVRVDGLPEIIDRIVLKLIAKNAEDRYQTAAGLEYDLRRCLAELVVDRPPELFELGARDVPSRVVVPEKLYGRQQEIRELIEAFTTVSSQNSFDFILVSGEPGAGKSSIVSELRSEVYRVGGLFAAGKFDQYKRDVPYATLASAFHALVRQFLRLSADDLQNWKKSILATLRANAQVMIDLFPDLELIIGKQPPVPSVPPQEAKNRFHVAFRDLVTAFSQREHPLVLFLDDLQWLDTATLELLESLAGDEQIPYLLLIGAYRSTEVGHDHVLSEALERISAARGGLQHIELRPLRLSDVADVVADTLRADMEYVEPLARVVFEKTQGNPFFVAQFLMNLDAEGLLSFDQERAAWRWDIDGIERQAMTENVAAMLAGKLGRYKNPMLGVIQYLACFGKGATPDTLRKLTGSSAGELGDSLRTLVDAGLVCRVGHRYSFVHDGVRDAAYALVPDAQRPTMHLAVGRLLHSNFLSGESDEDVFDVVSHFNRGIIAVEAAEERHCIAQLNLLAGQRSIAAAAYSSALHYLNAGCDLLDAESWDEDHRLTFELQLNQTDCRFMLDDVGFAEERLAALANRTRNASELALVVGRQASLYTFLGRIDHAVELLIDCLQRLGVDLPLHPSEDEIAAEYAALVTRIGTRRIDDLGQLPPMTDPKWRIVMEPMVQLFSAAGVVNHDLHHLAVLRMCNITLDHGLTDESAHGFACVGGLILGWRYGTFDMGHDFGRLSMRLVDDHGYGRYAPRIYAIISGTVGPWSRPLIDCYAIAVRASEMGREQGGITYSAYSWSCALTALLDSGRSLADVDRQAGHSLSALAKMKYPLVVDFMTTQLMMVRALRGMTNRLDSMSDGEFDEAAFASRLAGSPHLWHAFVRYRIRRLQLLVISGDMAEALDVANTLDDDAASLQVFEAAEYQFYSALCRAAAIADGLVDRDRNKRLLLASYSRLRGWERLCPENFADRAQLVGAEIARIEGRELDAEREYEASIQLSQQHGFLQNEALANELAAKFHAARGMATIAKAYRAEAHTRYRLWGALEKARQLEQIDPGLAAASEAPVTSAGTGMRLQNLDLAAAVDLHQALSREIVLDRLIERVMTTVIEHAGAVRGLLLLSQEGRLRIVAEADTSSESVIVNLRRPAHFSGELPQSMLDYVQRTHEAIIIDDALAPNAHSIDPYILRARPRSVLCLPLVKQARLVGVLYLENDLSSHIFTQDRLAVLQFVASQAAISIENAELFQDVQRTQEVLRHSGEELRRSFDMIPALAWSAAPDGNFEFSNKQWHDYTGISEQEARSGTWMRAFHPDDLDKVSTKWRFLSNFRTSGEFEARMRRFDGVYRSFLVRLTPMRDERGDVVRWHGTNTDIDDLKKVEAAQEALARASRITAMGELTVSIAHEVNQPLMAIVTNAASCLRWLENATPNVEEARRAAERIIRDGHRAGDVVASIRALAKKSTRDVTDVRLDEVVLEVVRLTRSETDRHSIEIQTDFHPDGLIALADRVQLQQVILNLVMNGSEAIAAADSPLRVIKVATKPGDPGFVEVMVADTGCGLPTGVGDDIFDAFFTTKRDGIGIGLSICRNIIESHGGKLSVSSANPSGSAFRFTVPTSVAGGSSAVG